MKKTLLGLLNKRKKKGVDQSIIDLMKNTPIPDSVLETYIKQHQEWMDNAQKSE